MTPEEVPFDTTTLAETENYNAWSAQEPDETTFHIETGRVTVHFFREEWDEFLALARQIVANRPPTGDTLAETENFTLWVVEDDPPGYELEIENANLYFNQEDWQEFVQMLRGLVTGA